MARSNPRMNFRLKTLFSITVVVALVVACFASDRRALSEVSRLQEIVDVSLVEIEGVERSKISRSEFRNEFVLFSSGNLSWEVELGNRATPAIEVTWNSHFVFSDKRAIFLTHGDTVEEQRFAKEFTRLLQTHRAELTVLKSN